VYYELLKPTETITGDRYRTQLMRLSRALKDKRPQYNERLDKVILQHDNVRHCESGQDILGNVEMGSPTPPAVFSRRCFLWLSLVSINGLADQHFWSYEEVKNWIDSWIASKDDQFFRREIRTLPERWEKVVRWTILNHKCMNHKCITSFLQ